MEDVVASLPVQRPSREPRARNYCFTLNFGENEPFQLTPELDGWALAGAKFCSWQLEVGDQGNLHIQGYLELKSAFSMVWVHKNLPGLAGAALFVRGGSAIQAYSYTRKPESRVDGPWEWGVSRCVAFCDWNGNIASISYYEWCARDSTYSLFK